ncbi:MAG TPA: hydroxymethylbilane synthase [Aggregatilineales bacterium]|nr:hydroxymethylbilane synthase [Aggregatilineales bacterium]
MSAIPIRIGTRGSALAVTQAESVAAAFRALYPERPITTFQITTRGDQERDTPLPEVGGKGLFTGEIEAALREGVIDLAVHSLKDLPTLMPPEVIIAAVPRRASPYDCLISRTGQPLANLPLGATLGTSSPRRAAQLLSLRPDLRIISIRGNVPTRIEKLRAEGSPYDGILLAVAGLERLGEGVQITEILPPPLMLPAPGQGALAIQCRSKDRLIEGLLRPLNDAETRMAVEAERAFLQTLEAGCSLPVAALARVEGAALHLIGRVLRRDGTESITVRGDAPQTIPPHLLGERLAEDALKQGARGLLA